MIRDRPRPCWHDLLIMVPVLAALALVPLVVYLRVVPLSGELFDFWNGQHANYDFFSYYKARLLVGLSVAALVGLVVTRGTRALRELPIAAGLLVACYAALTVVSAWGSPFRSVVLDGFSDRYEGLLVLLSYLVMMVASFAALTSAHRAQSAALWLAVSACVVGAVGVCQFAGLDPFQTEWGRVLILPAEFRHVASQLQYPTEARTVYATLYHYNYVGSYAALVLPFLLVLAASEALPLTLRRVSGCGAAFVAFGWVVCGSRAGLVGGAVAIGALAVLLRARLQGHQRTLARIAGALLLAVLVANIELGGRLRMRAIAIVADLTTLFSEVGPQVPVLPFELASIDGRVVHLKTPGGALDVHHEVGNLSVYDEGRRQLQMIIEGGDGRVRIDDGRFAGLALTVGRIGGRSALVVQSEGYVLNFLLLESGIELALKTGRTVSTAPVATLGFAGRERVGSARGFIWSRSLPLLPHALFLGYGPDTVALVFPQQDFTGKYRVYGTTDMLVDKVHNLFLQTALNTGVLSALVLLALFGWYLVTSARMYFSRPTLDPGGALGAACFVAVAGYLTAGLFNDSVVSVAPVFWVILGLGIRMNVNLTGACHPEPVGSLAAGRRAKVDGHGMSQGQIGGPRREGQVA